MRRLIANLIAMVMLLTLPAMNAKASNETFEDEYNFIAYTIGDGVVHFKVLAWSSGGYNHWAINRWKNAARDWPLSHAILRMHQRDTTNGGYALDKDGNTAFMKGVEQTLFYWTAKNYSGDNKYEITNLEVRYGTIRATDAVSKEVKSVTYKEGGDNKLSVYMPKEKCGERDAYYIEFDWIAPENVVVSGKGYDLSKDAFGIEFYVKYDRQLEETGGILPWCKDDIKHYVRDLTSESTLTTPYFIGQSLAEVSDSTQIGMTSTSVLGTASVKSYKTFLGTKEYISDDYTQGDKYVCTVNLPQCDSTRTVNAEVKYYLNLDASGQSTRVLRTKEPQIMMPLHAIKYAKFGEYHPSDNTENAGYNLLTWGFDWPDHEDYMSSDYFMVKRAYKEDYSDAEIIGYVPVTSFSSYTEVTEDEGGDTDQQDHKIRTQGYFQYLDATNAATYSTQPASTDKYHNVLGLNDTEYEALCSGNTKDQTLLDTMKKKYFMVPEQKIYYSVERAVLSSIYGSASLPSKYKTKGYVYKTQQLPPVSGITVKKNTNWDNKHGVTLGISLANPYINNLPEFSQLSTATKQQLMEKSKEKGWNSKLYTWDQRAKIVVKRYASYNKDFSNAVITVDTIDGGNVTYNSDSTAYYVELVNTQDRAYTYYKYEAYVDNHLSVYPIILNDAVQPTEYNAEDYYYNVAALAKTINASKGYYSDQIFVSWQRITGQKSTVELYRRLSGTDDWGTPVKTITDDTNYYRDRDNLEAGKWYDYRLVVSYQHENGQVYSSEATASGCTSVYGEVSGRVTLKDGGTAMSGVTVTATPNKSVTVRNGALSLPVTSLLNKQLLTMQSVDQMKLSDGYTVQYWTKSIPLTVGNVQMQPTNNFIYVGDDVISMDGEGRLSVNGKTASSLPATAPTADYLCVTVTKDAASGETKMYVDSVLVGTANTGAITKVGAALTIASNWHIDEMRIWNKPLAKEKIADFQQRMISGREQNLVAYYRFDDDAQYAGGYCADLAYQTASDVSHHDLRMMDGTEPVTDASTLQKMTDTQGLNPQVLANIVTTAADGSYTLGGLPVSESVTYTITPSAGGQTAFENTVTKEASVTKDMTTVKNNYTDVNFECKSSVIFSGRVLYENSTIPVRDAYFLINGEKVMSTSNNVVTTDQNGEFRFAVPTVNMTFQVVKDGHHFVRDGYVYRNGGSEDETRFVPSADYTGIELWDSTRVRLAGRVVGGTVQSAKMLGAGLSTNNLGDNITLTMALEGDNTSNLYYLTDKPEVTEMTDSTTIVALSESVDGAAGNPFSVKTKVKYERQRLTINPDPRSGEFYIDLFPVKYKITQAYAQGYSTLFSSGETSQVLDLSQAINKNIEVSDTVTYNNRVFNLTSHYDATYQRVYHSPVSVTYEQLNGGIYGGPLGDLTSDMPTIEGTTTVVPTVKYDDDTEDFAYVFGYPVFSEDENYTLRVQAHEDFYYNNDTKLGKHDQVPVTNCSLNIQNGMNKKQPVLNTQIDETGSAIVSFTVDNVDFSSTGTAALKTINLDVEVDNYHYSATPIQGYVRGAKIVGNDVVCDVESNVQLLDILRDPPGSTSYSYVSEGSTYAVARKFNVSGTLNLNVSMSTGSFSSPIVGQLVGGSVLNAEMLTLAQMQNYSTAIPVYSLDVSRSANYTLTINDRLSTSSNPSDVGANADLYIGTTNSLVVARVENICTIDTAMYKLYQSAINDGKIKIITEGTNTMGDKYYLAVVNELASGVSNPVTYAYSQSHILTKVLPSLLESRNALLLTGDSLTVQKLANQKNEVLYWSKVQPGEAGYGIKGYYSMVYPEGYDKLSVDMINSYNNRITRWWGIIAYNEKSKLDAIQTGSPYATYSVSGNVPISHSESETDSDDKPDGDSNYNYTHSAFGIPIPVGLKGEMERFRSAIGAQGGVALGSTLVEGVTNLVSNGLVYDKTVIASKKDQSEKLLQQYKDLLESMKDSAAKERQEIAAAGVKYVLYAYPSVENWTWTSIPSFQSSNNKSTGYYLAADGDSYFDVSIYRTPADGLAGDSTIYRSLEWITESPNQARYLYISDYVFDVQGGATRPWMAPDSTLMYQPGTPLTGSTMKIDNPKITVSKPVVSNIPQDDKAVFYVTMQNDSELPKSASLRNASTFVLRVLDETNTEGAKITMDGASLTSGRTFTIAPHTSLTKTIEVARGQKYDYENIGLALSTSNYDLTDVAPISVHYMPTSSPVKITAPTANWTMNTLSPHDTIGYYLPMVIDGFNQNYDGFDHIEIQYKQSTQSDDDWVNLCSYYAEDSLYNAASGNKAMITSGRITDFRFYGERDPMEMKYDLRAVAFSRVGTSFVTRSSDIISGTKDTRPPHIIGMPKPTNSILGAGEYATLSFTEPIAYNYLDKTSNFDVYGAINGGTTINNSSALYFPGRAEQQAATTVKRNLNARSFSVDMLVTATEASRDQVLFTHGTGADRLVFSINKNNQLQAQIGGNVYVGKTHEPTEWTGAMSHVGLTVDSTRTLKFFCGNDFEYADNAVISYQLPEDYTVNDYIYLGSDAPTAADRNSTLFAGRMLEVRLWSAALSAEEVSKFNQRRADGYSHKMVAHWPLTQVTGTTAEESVGGAALALNATQWSTRQNYSLVISNKAEEINPSYMARNNSTDYTLSFWYKVQERTDSVSIFSASKKRNDDATQRFMRLDLKNDSLVFRSGLNDFTLQAKHDDSKWHHFALTVNRSSNIATVYLDDYMVMQESGDLVNGIATDYVAFGDANMKGRIDQLQLWNSALSADVLAVTANVAPLGTESGLLVYMPFERSVKSSQGLVTEVFSPYNESTNIATDTDVRLLEDENATGNNDDWAPVRATEQYSKLDFDWSSDGTNLYIYLTTPLKDINKQQVYFSVRDVKDVNGNPMEVPQTWTMLVDCNQVRWVENTLATSIDFGQGDTLLAEYTNTGGSRQNISFETDASWLQLGATQAVIDGNTKDYLTFSIKESLNPGAYVATVDLIDSNGLSDPLTVVAVVTAEEPTWEVDRTKYNESMSFVGRVYLKDGDNEKIDYNPLDIVAAFTSEGECLGKSYVTVDENNGSGVYLTIYGNASLNNQPVNFRLWRADKGYVVSLAASEEVRFVNNGTYGISSPVRLVTQDTQTQLLRLEQGWNWISLNVKPDAASTLNTSFANLKAFTSNDRIKYANAFSVYDGSRWSDGVDHLSINNVYQIYVQKAGQYRVSGSSLTADDKVISLAGNAWSSLPYVLKESLPIAEAMADYSLGDKGTAGDIIKSLDQFAVLSENNRWVGSLQTLSPGVGYFIKRNAAAACTVDLGKATGSAVSTVSSSTSAEHAETMPVIAVFNTSEFDVQPNDKLVAYSNDGSVAGTAEKIDMTDGTSRYFLTVNAEPSAKVSLAQVRDNDVVAVGTDKLTMSESGVVGTIQRPYVITLGTESISVDLGNMPTSADVVVVSAEDTEVTIGCYTASGQKEYETVEKVVKGQNVYSVPVVNNGEMKLIDVRLANGNKKVFKIACDSTVE